MAENIQIRVNLDVMGWNSELSEHHEAECREIISLARTAVAYGYDAIELAEVIVEHQRGLFESITATINRSASATVVTLFAIGAQKIACQ